MKVNLNSRVRVRLTPLGLAQYAAKMRRFNEDSRCFARQPLTPRLTEDGYYETELWNLMNEFGGVFCNGGALPFDGTDIEVVTP